MGRKVSVRGSDDELIKAASGQQTAPLRALNETTWLFISLIGAPAELQMRSRASQSVPMNARYN